MIRITSIAGRSRRPGGIRAPDDPNTAYAYTELKLRIVPSPRDITRAEIVDSWIVWLHSTEGKRGAHRVWHWARGAPQWLLAQRENCSERTIINRIDRLMAKILAEFLCTEVEVGHVEEPAEQPVRSFHGEHVSEFEGSVEKHGKCWIDGVGFYEGREEIAGREGKGGRREAVSGSCKVKGRPKPPLAHDRSGPGKTATDVSFLRVAGLA